MRFLFGLIIGIALTIGAAYLHDMNLAPATASSDPNAAATASTPIVNWPALQALVHDGTETVRTAWNKLVG